MTFAGRGTLLFQDGRCSFSGKIGRFRAIMAMAGIEGVWRRTPAAFWQFKCLNGGVVNWWPSTGTVNFQGPAKSAGRLRRSLRRAVRERTSTVDGPSPRHEITSSGLAR